MNIETRIHNGVKQNRTVKLKTIWVLCKLEGGHESEGALILPEFSDWENVNINEKLVINN